MPALREVQAAFAAAVLEGRIDAALADRIVAAGLAPERRIGVYRANVVLSLRRLLEGTFPACRRLLGGDRFAGLADRFVRLAPPGRPQLLAYGGEFPAFLRLEDPLIADVAVLEWAREQSCHAIDAPSLNVSILAAIPAERYPHLTFEPHPSLRLVRSAGPVYALWSGEPIDSSPQQVLVVRQAMSVTTRPITPGDLALLEGLTAGRSLEQAAAAALGAEPEFDLQVALAHHLIDGSFAACH